MKKHISLVLALTLLLSLSCPALAAGEPVLTLSSAETEPGAEVTLILSIRNNPGLKGISAELVYDPTVLTLISASPLIDDGTWMIETIAEDHLVYWYSTTAYTGEAVASVTFRAAGTAPAGTTQVGLRFGDWDGVYDADGAEITDYSVSPGTVTIQAPDFKLPASLQVIEDEAFAGTAVRFASLPKSLARLGSRIFAGCTRLAAVYAPALVTEILPDMFDGVPDAAKLLGPLGSAIAAFAAEYGLRFEAVEIARD